MIKDFDKDAFKREIEKCTNQKQVKAVLKKFNRKIVKYEKEMMETMGCFSIWISETERIYKPYRSKTMKYQIWGKRIIEYSGIPTFFATGSSF